MCVGIRVCVYIYIYIYRVNWRINPHDSCNTEQHNIVCSVNACSFSSLLTSQDLWVIYYLLSVWNAASISSIKSAIFLICFYSPRAQLLSLEWVLQEQVPGLVNCCFHCPAPIKAQHICVKEINQSSKLILQTHGSIYLMLPNKPPQYVVT